MDEQRDPFPQLFPVNLGDGWTATRVEIIRKNCSQVSSVNERERERERERDMNLQNKSISVDEPVVSVEKYIDGIPTGAHRQRIQFGTVDIFLALFVVPRE